MPPVLSDQPMGLTERQRQVVALIAAGCSNQEVGERLGISLVQPKRTATYFGKSSACRGGVRSQPHTEL